MKNQTNKPEDIYATVDEVIKILQAVSAKGKGSYLVSCNTEYLLARKDEIPAISDKLKSVDMGGYV